MSTATIFATMKSQDELRNNLSLKMEEVAKCRIAKFEKQSEKVDFTNMKLRTKWALPNLRSAAGCATS